MKKWVIPDLHGCARTLKALMEDRIKPDGQDILIFLGDYIDRGPDPKGTIDYIFSLEKAGLNIIPLKGNHEEYLLLALDKEQHRRKRFLFFSESNKFLQEWIGHGGNDTLNSFNVSNVNEIPDEYISWIRTLSNYHIEDQYFIVHAGLNFKHSYPLEDTHAMLWTRSFEVVPEKIGNRKIIHGHVPVTLDFLKSCISDHDHPYIPLDNGCYLPGRAGMGNLVAFELTTGKLEIQPNAE